MGAVVGDVEVESPVPMPAPESASVQGSMPSASEASGGGEAVDRPTPSELALGPGSSWSLEGWTETAHWYPLGDGRRRVEFATNRAWFQRPDGSWARVDRSLVPAGPGVLGVAADETSPWVTVVAGSSLVTLPTLAGPIVMAHPGAAPVEAVAGAEPTEVRYPGALSSGRDVVVRAVLDGVKDSVVVPDRAAGRSYDLVFVVPLGVVARSGPAGVEFVDAAGSVVALLERGIASDSASSPSEAAVEVEVVGQVGVEVTVRASVAAGWFDAPGRVFPVTLDPTFTTPADNDRDPRDAYYNSDRCDNPLSETGENYYSQDHLRVGGPNVYLDYCADPYDGSGGNQVYKSRTRTFTKWWLDPLDDDVPEREFQVGDADAAFYVFYSISSSSLRYEARELRSSFSSSSTWNTQPKRSTGVADTDLVGGVGDWTDFDIDAVAQRWLDGSTSYGIGVYADALGSVNEFSDAYHKRFSSGERGDGRPPTLTIDYTAAPSRPQNVVATPGAYSAAVTWQAPADDGGSAITKYVVRAVQNGVFAGQPVEACASCTSATVSGLAPGTYEFWVYAWNAIGDSAPAKSPATTIVDPLQLTKVVGTVSGGAVDCAASPPGSYAPGDMATYCVTLANQGTTTLGGLAVVDDLPAGLSLVAPTVVVGGAPCTPGGSPSCEVSANRLRVSGISLGAGASLRVTYRAVASGVRGCSPLTNAARIEGSTRPPVTVTVTVCGWGLGVEDWWRFVERPLGPQSRALVNVANGNLVVQQDDSTPVHAHGDLAFGLRRTYNSQDAVLVDLGSPVGAGWTLNVGETGDLAGFGVGGAGLSVPSTESVTAPGAVTLIDRDGTRHVFRPNGIAARVDVTGLASSPDALLATLVPQVLKLASGGLANRICVDQTYVSPPGVHVRLWRYVALSSLGGLGGTDACAPLPGTSPVVLGFAAMRPDRVRQEFSASGRLLHLMDGNGTSFTYRYDNEPAPGVALGRLRQVWESSSCASADDEGCRSFAFSYAGDAGCAAVDGGSATCVSDPARRTTRYVRDGQDRLVSVENPDGSAWGYGYGGCGGGTNQLCWVRDLRGNTTSFAYQPDGKLSAVTDRRQSATTFGYTSTYTTADRQGQRQLFDAIDGAGRVGRIDEGTTSAQWFRRTTLAWDAPGVTCREPDHAVDNNLCSQTRASLTAASPDERSEFVYNAEGRLLVERRLNGTLGASVSTSGYRTQSASAGGAAVTEDRVAGGGQVSVAPRDPNASVFVVSDPIETLSPRGNEVGAAFAPYLRSWRIDANPAANPNARRPAGWQSCADPAAPVGNTGNVCEETGPAVDGTTRPVTRYTYDRFGQRLTMRTPNALAAGDARAFRYEYFADGDRDLSGRTSAGGWLRAVVDPYDQFVAFGYDAAGNVIRAWDRNATAGMARPAFPGTLAAPPNTRYSQTLYAPGTAAEAAASPWRYVWASRDPAGNRSTYTLDAHGNQLTIRPPRGNAAGDDSFDTTQTFDAADARSTRLLPEEHAADARWRWSYDSFGNKASETDPANNTTVWRYDPVNRLTTTIRPRGTSGPSPCRASTSADAPIPLGKTVCVTTAAYDGVDNLIAAQDANAQTTTNVYDGLHRLVEVRAPRDGAAVLAVTRTDYDADGNPVRLCRPRQASDGGTNAGCPVSARYAEHRAYTPAGALASSTTWRDAADAAGNTTSFRYDADGNQVARTDPRGATTTFSFDLLDRKLTETVPRNAAMSNTTSWRYDPAGNVTAIVRPGGEDLGDGRDGDLVVDGAANGPANPYVVDGAKQYASITLRNGGWLTAPAYTLSGGGILDVRVAGGVSVCVTCGITMAGRGPAGGAGGAGGGPDYGGKAGAGSGGGGVSYGNFTTGGGGGGGGHNGRGADGAGPTGTQPGAGGAGYGQSDLSDAFSGTLGMGSGGSGGAAGGGQDGGAGGNGGGLIRLRADRIVVDGQILAAGSPGQPGATVANVGGGGGGGGSGGSVWLAARAVTLNHLTSLDVRGGGGGASAAGGPGGAGAAGRVRIDTPALSGAGATSRSAWGDGPSVSAGNARITAYGYDAANRLVDTVVGADNPDAAAAGAATGGSNARTRWVYDPDGNVVATLEPRAFASSVATPDVRFSARVDYDRDGRPVARRQARYDTADPAMRDPGLGSSTQGEECPVDAGVNAEFGPTVGVCVSRAVYDAAGRVTTVFPPGADVDANRRVELGWTDDGLLARVNAANPASPAGRVDALVFDYDAAGRRTKTTNALNQQFVVAYFSDGLVRSRTDQPNGTVTHVTRFEYDLDGNQTAVVNAKSERSTASWWADGLVREQTDAAGNKTGYVYDAAGNVVEVRSPAVNAAAVWPHNTARTPVVHSWTLDGLLEATVVPVAPDGTVRRRTSYGYDPAGRNSSQRVDQLACPAGPAPCTTPTATTPGTAWSFSYLGTDRLATRSAAGGEQVAYGYDAAGNQTSVAVAGGRSVTAGWYLDGLVRLVDDGARTVTYAYGAAGALAVRADAASGGGGARVARYRYSAAGLPAAMTADVFGGTTSYDYDIVGRLTTTKHPNGLETLRVWNPDDTLASETLRTGGGVVRASWSYTYDNLYRQVSQTHANNNAAAAIAGTYSFGYDTAGRLASYSDAAGSHTLGWDPDGNRRSLTNTAKGTLAWTYRADGSIATVKEGTSPEKAYTYGPSGALAADECRTYGYDGFDRLTATGAGCAIPAAATTYDGLDRPVTATRPDGSTEALHYDGLDDTVLTSVAGGAETAYLPDPAGLAAAVARVDTGTVEHLGDDGHANIATATTPAGAVACLARFDPYGLPLKAQANNPCALGATLSDVFYRNTRRDPTTGTYTLGARTYDPAKATFLTPDTYRSPTPEANLSIGVDPLTRNTYTYLNGDPVNLVDPDGHAAMWADGGRGWKSHAGAWRPSGNRRDRVVVFTQGNRSITMTLGESAAVNARLGGSRACPLGPDGEVTYQRGGACGVYTMAFSRSIAQRIANASGGVLNALAVGQARRILSSLDLDDRVDFSSKEFRIAETATVVADLALGVAALAKGGAEVVRAVRAARALRGAATIAEEAPALVRVAAEAEGAETVQLFRHADPAELADIRATGEFRLGPNSTGKYFAESAEHAERWGQWLNGGGGGIVETSVPRSFADQLMRWEKLDGLGPARFVDPGQLDWLNRLMNGSGVDVPPSGVERREHPPLRWGHRVIFGLTTKSSLEGEPGDPDPV